jgi:hypothetical protein
VKRKTRRKGRTKLEEYMFKSSELRGRLHRRLAGGVALATLLALAVAPGSFSAGMAAAATSAKTVSLVAACPSTVTIMTDWSPEAEQGAYYELAASGGVTSSTNQTYTAPLLDPSTGKSTGVKVELLEGGPAVGFMSTPEYLNSNPSILMGADDDDTAIADFGTLPVVGIVAPFNNSLHILLWNGNLKKVNSFAALKKSNMTLLYFADTEFVEYMAGAGYVSVSQLDSSYTGSPSRFIASNGDIAEQGFATDEPFIYSHETTAWDKSIAYELTSNTGYNPYSEQGEATPANITKYAACFKLLVPMIQQAQISYLQSPARANKLIISLNKAYGENGGLYVLADAQYADKTLLGDRIVSQGVGAFGSYNIARVKTLIAQLTPILAKANTPLPAGDTAGTFVTNKFIDPNIKFTLYKGPYNDTKGVIVMPGVKK